MTLHTHRDPEPTPRWCSCAVPDDELEPTTPGVSRRNVLVGLSAAGVLAAAGWPGSAQAAPGDDSVTITIMGTSDLHSNAVNWDYYKDATFSDSAGNAVGLARVSSVVNQIRADRGREHTLLFDAGDTIQGSPLGFYYALVDPVTQSGAIHPMAAQMNAIGYDAVALGNHEFNYGLDFLDYWISQMDADVLAANAVHAGTKVPAFTPYTIKRMKVKGRPPIRVGVLGLTNPGVVIWDKANVSGKLEVQGLVEAAARWVPVIRAAGADVVVVSAHAGDSGTSSYVGDLPIENAAALVAEQVPGIDAILFGHAHKDVPQRLVTNAQTGRQVVLSEPKNWGQRVSVFDLTLEFARGKWSVTTGSALTVNTNTVVDDPALVAVVKAQHEAVVAYVNTPVAVSTEAMSAAEACWKDTAILDYVNAVQTATVAAAVAGTPEAALPVVSIAAPFNRAATFPAGQVTIKDVAGLYIYDNTLLASILTGAQIKDYLEYSAKYFVQVDPAAPVAPATWTNAGNTPDYNYDQFSGVEYGVDISQPVGSRIVGLAYNGAPVASDQQFLVAVNNYRQSGGGGFPHIAGAPVVYNAQVAIREAIVSYASAAGTIDPADFHVENWRLVRNGTPVF
ncbi:twin-arginine translocation signal domain-containing protein [Agromyces tardus]|jgi:2',3'-cyclic-nucleotide 2'-phosphodiesterase/3'-nucleotidase|uniref:Twin-arginine translocation signal domain-containing protein n=1 Tax=Agromyces tardus TaxID=2583849 RepID=A0A3M8AFB8_9MICO|nr:5'-nucleotidase C-terminal domain-containing protein [Agromyces tardus]RNB49906.1 twin-arginine translocation signal domain-containing protein [Agromyces tardus]